MLPTSPIVIVSTWAKHVISLDPSSGITGILSVTPILPNIADKQERTTWCQPGARNFCIPFYFISRGTLQCISMPTFGQDRQVSDRLTNNSTHIAKTWQLGFDYTSPSSKFRPFPAYHTLSQAAMLPGKDQLTSSGQRRPQPHHHIPGSSPHLAGPRPDRPIAPGQTPTNQAHKGPIINQMPKCLVLMGDIVSLFCN